MSSRTSHLFFIVSSSKQVPWPCHSAFSLTSHHRSTDSLMWKFMGDLWWAKRQYDRFYGAHHLSPHFPPHPCYISINLPSAVMENGPITGCSFKRQSHTTPLIKTKEIFHTCVWEHLVHVKIIHSRGQHYESWVGGGLPVRTILTHRKETFLIN
jgi:hypothetical protein